MAKKQSKKKRQGKKEPLDMTDDEAMRKLFPKAVRDEIKRQTDQAERKGGSRKKGR